MSPNFILPCNSVTLLLCYLVTLLPCYLVTLLPCYLATLLPCYPAFVWERVYCGGEGWGVRGEGWGMKGEGEGWGVGGEFYFRKTFECRGPHNAGPELNLLVILPDLSRERLRVRRHLNVKIQNCIINLPFAVVPALHSVLFCMDRWCTFNLFMGRAVGKQRNSSCFMLWEPQHYWVRQ